MTLLEHLFLHYVTTDAPHARTIAACERELRLLPGTYNYREHYPILCARWAMEELAIFERETAITEEA